MNLIQSILVRGPSPTRDLPGSQQLLHRSRVAIRRRDFDLAESFVMEGGDAVWKNAACLNLLGLIAEARGQWSKAKRFWGRSIRADRRYEPPRQNLRRYFELFQFGRSELCVALGDDPPVAIQELHL